MAKYKCMICGDIYDEEREKVKFADLPDDFVCPKCGVPKSMFEKVNDCLVIEDDITPNNAIKISSSNVAIVRDISKCVNCGQCIQTCKIKEGMSFDSKSELCVNCGQCIQTCPTNALMPKLDYERFKNAKKDKKVCIAYTSPSTRVSFAEVFGLPAGTFSQDKLVGLLKMIGFDYVFDTTFAADLTIMEEANELVDRISNNRILPMFTSCCPAWVKYAEQFYPEILDNISTCKSPIGMMGPIVKKYFTKEIGIKEENTYTVAITPCTAKKYEIQRKEITGTDLVITVYELVDIIKDMNIEYNDIKETNYDTFFEEGSGAGIIFGNTGGVMEAALRTAYNILTGKDLKSDAIIFNAVRGMDNVKEAVVKINNLEINVCVVNEMSSAKKILDDVKLGNSKYQYIEIMNCLGGCIGGGGQPKHFGEDAIDIKKKRIDSLYMKDDSCTVRCSHNNPQIIKLYNDFLKKPLSSLSKELLHTNYEDKSYLNK